MGTGDIVGILESQCDERDWMVLRARQAIRPHMKGGRETTVQVPSKKHVEAFCEALELEGFQWMGIGQKGAIRARRGETSFYVYMKGDGIQGIHPTILWDSTV